LRDKLDNQPVSQMPIGELTHCNSEGTVYRRDLLVEQQIARARCLSPELLRAQARLKDHATPEYLKEESLVYLIRHYYRAGNDALVTDLTESLVERCASLINGQLGRLPVEAARDGSQDVITRLFDLILDFDSDRGDFLQVRFWVVLERLTVRAFEQQLKQQQRMDATVPITALAGYDGDDEPEDGHVPKTQLASMAESTSFEAIVIDRALIDDALSKIDEPYRSAFLLKHYVGLPVEDDDPNVWTISRQFGKSPRMIRNWLHRVEDSLKTWRGEQQ
jgi:DNA-directed RNA polymerase specialized sigma24 family protein